MKTWLKTALLSGDLCCAVGAVLTAAGMLTGGKQYVQAADINTLRGAAGGAVLLAELLAAKGYFD